jgi:hypothetical protein
MRTPLVRALLLPLVPLLCGSCSSESDELSVKPERIFTGFVANQPEPATPFQVPATAYSPDKMQWAIGDKSLATIEVVDGGGHVTLTAQKAGKTVLRASANGKTKEIPVTITEYAQADLELGNDLYQSNKSSGDPGSAGTPGTVALGCIDCHGARGTATHDPTKIGGFDDDTVLNIIATGKLPDGTTIPVTHKWDLKPEQKKAILARVRSLQPRGWP